MTPQLLFRTVQQLLHLAAVVEDFVLWGKTSRVIASVFVDVDVLLMCY